MVGDTANIEREGQRSAAGDSEPSPAREPLGRYHAVKFRQGHKRNNGDQEQKRNRGAEMYDQDQGWQDTKSADESFQAGLLLAEDLVMRHAEAPFTLLIIDD